MVVSAEQRTMSGNERVPRTAAPMLKDWLEYIYKRLQWVNRKVQVIKMKTMVIHWIVISDR